MAIAIFKAALYSMKTAVGAPVSLACRPPSVLPGVIWRWSADAPAILPAERARRWFYPSTLLSKTMSMKSAGSATAPTERALYDAFIRGDPVIEQLEPCAYLSVLIVVSFNTIFNCNRLLR